MPGKILKSAAHAGIKNAQESLRVSLSQSMVIFPLHVPFTPWSPTTRSVYVYRPTCTLRIKHRAATGTITIFATIFPQNFSM